MQSTMISEPPGDRPTFVWAWRPDATEPVVAGRLDRDGAHYSFAYGTSYLERPDAIALYGLPLRRGAQMPSSGTVAGCLLDAGPDAWGRRVIEHRRRDASSDLDEVGYLLRSGSNRIGALDFQTSATDYVERSSASTLEELALAAQIVEAGKSLSAPLDEALLHGSSVGGARPKVLVHTGERQAIAKFSSSTDSYPVVRSEFVAMRLAECCSLQVAPTELTTVLGKDVLLVDRFDRLPGRRRRMVVSAMTILDLHDADGIAGRYATYPDLADAVRARFTDAAATLRELFARIVFNVLVGNTDDHARNHAAFWDGEELTLTPAYDICPQARGGEEAAQAMAFGRDGDRLSQVHRCIDHADVYHMDRQEARAIAENQIETIHDNWDEVCDQGCLTSVDRERLWNRQILNPFALYDF